MLSVSTASTRVVTPAHSLSPLCFRHRSALRLADPSVLIAILRVYPPSPRTSPILTAARQIVSCRRFVPRVCSRPLVLPLPSNTRSPLYSGFCNNENHFLRIYPTIVHKPVIRTRDVDALAIVEACPNAIATFPQPLGSMRIPPKRWCVSRSHLHLFVNPGRRARFPLSQLYPVSPYCRPDPDSVLRWASRESNSLFLPVPSVLALTPSRRSSTNFVRGSPRRNHLIRITPMSTRFHDNPVRVHRRRVELHEAFSSSVDRRFRKSRCVLTTHNCNRLLISSLDAERR